MKIKLLPIECPFCHQIPELFKVPLWQGSHGYHGSYEYYVKCTNVKCKIKPETNKYNDIYDMNEGDCFNKAIDDWNSR